MDLYLQFGWGMMEHCRVLVRQWKGGTVILSPRDLKPAQITSLSREINRLPGGRVMIDPQFYLPHSDHKRLTSHSFWPSSYTTSDFWSGADLTALVKKILDLNHKVGSSGVILPGLYADTVDDDWLARQQRMAEEAARQANGARLYATVALAADTARSPDAVHEILDSIDSWPVHGIYLVVEHPRGDYLVKDPIWVANVVDLVAGVRLRGLDAILGYANHQLLIAALGSATAIASGTWMNVRSFPPEKFRVNYDEEIKQRAVWCYCPQALSEYKLPSLDVAHRTGVLQSMKPSADFDGSLVEPMFSGLLPSAAGLGEREAFRHYLDCLRVQTLDARRATFEATVEAHEKVLDSAEELLATLRRSGVRGALRDFQECIEVNRAAIGIIRTTRGPILERSWNRI